MRASYYSRALHALLATAPTSSEKLLKQFTETVVANGHAHLLPKIVRSFEKLTVKDEKASTIEVVSATPLTEAAVAALLKQEPYKLALSPSHKKVVRKTDDAVIGGIVVRTGAMRIDGSHKRALLDLYQNMTNTL
jgi:F0F1-type ATP synthase delta subunit